MKKKIIHFSDIHLGNKNMTEEQIENLMNIISIKYNRDTIIVFSGDLFHYKVDLDSKASRLALRLLTFLNSLEIPSIFINGTRSHDYNYQKSVRDTFPYIKFIDEVTELEIDGLKILCVPEEYIDNQLEYYSNTIYNNNKKYDMIIFHGTISDIANFNTGIEEIPYKRAPSFRKSDFFNKSNLICCGHIHKPQLYKTEDNKLLVYAGSYGRLVHGEEEPKGLWVYNIEKDENDSIARVIDYEFIKNNMAVKLVDYNIKEVEDDSRSTISILVNNKEFTINDFIKLIEKNYQDNVYIRLVIKQSFKNEKTLNKLFSNLEKKYPNVSILNKNKKINNFVERNKSNIEFIKELKKVSSIEEELNLFIKKKMNIDLSIDRIKDLLK